MGSGSRIPVDKLCSASRQRLLLAATNFSMLCVPEGGMNYDWDLTYIVDGELESLESDIESHLDRQE